MRARGVGSDGSDDEADRQVEGRRGEAPARTYERRLCRREERARVVELRLVGPGGGGSAASGAFGYQCREVAPARAGAVGDAREGVAESGAWLLAKAALKEN